MKKIIVIIFLFLGLSICYWFFKKDQQRIGVSPASEFNLATQDLAGLETSAHAANCQAAYQLARYHNNFTLKYEDAVYWFRLAVKCPETNPKLELIALLMGDNNLEHREEIRQLIEDIRKTDPTAAKRAEEAMQTSSSEH